MKNKNIIVATDMSQKSFNVIQKAYEFAREKEANLYIVHIVEESFFSQTGNIDTIRKFGFSQLQKAFSFLKPQQFFCEIGEVERSLQSFVQKLDASLLIMGASGEGNKLKSFFLGSSTKAIVRSVSVPCLVVKTQDSLRYSNILAVTDLSDASRKHILRLRTLFENAYIQLFYTYVVPFESRLSFYGMNSNDIEHFQRDVASGARKKAYAFYESLDVDKSKVKLVTKEGHLDTDFFLHEAKELGTDLIALHTTGKVSFFAFDLLGDAKSDVFIYKT